MKITVAELTPENAQAYFKLRKTSEIELPQYVGPSAERELLAGGEGIAKIMTTYAHEGTVLFGAFSDNTLVDIIAVSRRLSPKFKHRAFIWGMYVSCEYRQLKIGTLLLSQVKNWAKNHADVRVLWLQVTTSNTPAIAFYTQDGFEIYGTEPQSLFTQGEYHHAHYMQIDV